MYTIYKEEKIMVKFMRDLSEPGCMNLAIKKNMDRQDIRLRCLYLQLLAALLGFFAVYKWLYLRSNSIFYPLLAFLCLVLILCARKLLSTLIGKQIMMINAQNPLKSEYTMDEDGVHIHTEHSDILMHWNHFVGWGTQGEILYLDCNDSRVMMCHRNQVSQEDFAQLKALAAAHIPAQK